MVPFSGGVLIGVALFWVLPEMAEFFGWPWLDRVDGRGVRGAVGDRPLCLSRCARRAPERTRTNIARTELHGFAVPLLAAAALHSALDGWGLAAAHSSFTAAFRQRVCDRDCVSQDAGGNRAGRDRAGGACHRAGRRSRGAPWRNRRRWREAALESLFAPHLNGRDLHALLAHGGRKVFVSRGARRAWRNRRSGAAPRFCRR